MIDLTHIHPMLVHFPIVLFLTALSLDLTILARGQNLAARQCLPMMAMVVLGAGILVAALAAAFGDLALDAAVAKGFPQGPLERHEAFGMATLWIFLGLGALRFIASWRGVSLAGWRGGLYLALSLGAVGVLLTAAYFGGQLVYDLGVNVLPVHP